MDRNIFILISLTSMVLSAVAGAQIAEAAESGSSDFSHKIDADLREILKSTGNDRIPVIVMLKGTEAPNTGDYLIRYSYRLIPGLAVEASSTAIRKMAESDRVSAIYFDGPTKISAPFDDNNSIYNSTFGTDSSSVQSDYNQSGLNQSDNSHYISPAQIVKADRIWEKGIDGRGVNVAVIDSGIDKNHPDLVGKVIAEKNFLANEITADDLLGHGTMIAGIIAGSGAVSDGKYKGIAPGASLINVKVIDQNGDGKVSDIIAGIEWAIYNGADVLSLSLGGINLGETNPPITMAADNAADLGVVVCVAAGNRNSTENKNQLKGASSSQLQGRSPVELSQAGESGKGVYFLFVPIVLALPPGLIDSPGDGVNVITLGSTDVLGHMASFSGSGPTRDDRIKPDVVAPGMDIISTVPAGLKGPKYVDIYYARESGTSLSTPIAAGLAALLLQERENLTPAGVKGAMTSGAVKLSNTHGVQYEAYYQGAGLLDALHSYELLEELNDDISGVIPDQWNPGRWAYLPSGEGVYVGLNTGADRPQKKIYALAPGDKDWNTRFVFFSNAKRDGLLASASGELSDWISLQALPQQISSNGQEVFATSIAVPEDANPGEYSGSIDITDSEETILSIPVGLTIAEPLSVFEGRAMNTGSLTGNQWDYYYLDMPVGAKAIDASLNWSLNANATDSNSSLDLFLLSPTSEYYAAAPEGSSKRAAIQSPPSGRWIIAVYSENASAYFDYTLNVEQEMIKTTPKRWYIESANPGMNASQVILLENEGPILENLSYSVVIENESLMEYEGIVGLKEIWNRTVNVTNETRRLSVELATIEGSRYSEVALVLEDPDGMASEKNADLGSGYLGPVEVSIPKAGRWVINVYGYNVPKEGQPFRLTIKQYAERPWSWVNVSGPNRLESGGNGTLLASLFVPKMPGLYQLDGYIKVSSDNSTIEIPVSVSLKGSEIRGLNSEEVQDVDGDGRFDLLTLGFGVNVSIPGEFRLEGVANDCQGNRIDVIDQSLRLDETGEILVNISGTDIWAGGQCGPMKIENLILYDKVGNYLDRYKGDISINRSPKEFQAPAAYITGFVNQTTNDSIAVGVNLSVTKPGSYQIAGFMVDDAGDDIGYESMEKSLERGNYTLSLQFSPADFMMLEDVSSVTLVDLVLTSGEDELEKRDIAWTSGLMDPGAFRTGVGGSRASNDSVGLAGSGSAGSDSADFPFSGAAGAVMRRVNGTVVIS